jgi:hypothetical protein
LLFFVQIFHGKLRVKLLQHLSAPDKPFNTEALLLIRADRKGKCDKKIFFSGNDIAVSLLIGA